jgi:hypothetical protein
MFSGWVCSTVGPGVMPWIMKALNIIAIMLFDGMPKAKSIPDSTRLPHLRRQQPDRRES